MLELNLINSQKSTFGNWDEVFSKPTHMELKTIKAGVIVSKVSGLINLKNPHTKEIRDGKAIVPVLAHLIRHPEFGYFLVDTGLSSSFTKMHGGSFKGLIKSFYFKNRYLVKKGEGIDEQLEKMIIDLKAVFITHAHEHLAGLDSLPKDILRICGSGEKDINFFPLVYSDFFKKFAFLKLDFSNAQDMPILGKVIDIFGDGSFWAICTSGHTKGHVSYLVNNTQNPIFITGDACITEKGFNIGVEPGIFSEDATKGRESFIKIKEFVARYPQIETVFGHETDEYKIKYI